MAERGRDDGRREGNIGSLKAVPWYTMEGALGPEIATPELLKGIRDLLRREIETRLTNAGQPSIGRLQKIKISDAGGEIFLELEINNSVPYGYGEAEVLRFCNRLDAENVLVTQVNLLPAGALLEYGKGGPQTDTGVFYIKTFAERTTSGGSFYRSSDLEGVSLNGDFLIEFLRANRRQFALDGFGERMEELERVGMQGKTESANKDKDLERARELVERQGGQLREAAGILRKAEIRHFRSKAEIEGLKFNRNIMAIIIAILALFAAMGVINPQGCQRIHDIVTGKARDNGAERQSGGTGRSREGSGR